MWLSRELRNTVFYGRMEYDTPSRFIRDIEPSLLQVEGSAPGIAAKSSPRPTSFNVQRQTSQNPRPVATQFVADPKPRLVPVRHEAPRPQSAIGNIGLQAGNVIEHQRFGVGTVIPALWCRNRDTGGGNR